MTNLNEEALQLLEQEIPKLAQGATKQAYVEALASGNSVIKVVKNQLVEYFADGTFKVLKNMQPSIKVETGSTVRLSE